MTSHDILKISAIKAILEAIEEGDEDDARQAIRMVRALLGGGDAKGDGK